MGMEWIIITVSGIRIAGGLEVSDLIHKYWQILSQRMCSWMFSLLNIIVAIIIIAMNSFNIDYANLDPPLKQKLKLQCKFLLVLTVLILAIGLYFLIAVDPTKKPDSHIIASQDRDSVSRTLNISDKSQVAEKFVVQVMEDCECEISISIQDVKSEGEFELPEESPFPYTKCKQKKHKIYNYHLDKSGNPYFQLLKSNELILSIPVIRISKSLSQVDLHMQNATLYGLGDTDNTLQVKPNDSSQIWPNPNNFGYHPMWFGLTSALTPFVGFIRTTVQLQYNRLPDGLSFLFQTNLINFKLFLYNSLDENIKAYHRYINGYRLFSLQSLGLQYFADIDSIDSSQVNSFLDIFDERSTPIQSIFLNSNAELTDQQILEISEKRRIQLMTSRSILVEAKEHVDPKYLIKSGTKDSILYGCYNQRSINYYDYNTKQNIDYGSYAGYGLIDNWMPSQISQELTVDQFCPQSLGDKLYTIPENAFHYAQKKSFYFSKDRVYEKDFRPLNSIAQQNQYSQENKQLYSQATMYGSGQFAGHIFQTQSLSIGISSIIRYQFYGIPYTGVNGCNQGIEDIRQCSFWLSLQSWLPLLRVYTNKTFELNDVEYYQQIKGELDLRSKLSKWIFSQFLKNYDASINRLTGIIIQPTWWLNLTDKEAFDFEDKQFLFASTYLIAPVLEEAKVEGFDNMRVYFPDVGNWMQLEQHVYFQGGGVVEFPILKNSKTPMFQRVGTIVFKQEPKLRVEELDNNFHLIGILDRTLGYAVGYIATVNDYSLEHVHEKCMHKKRNCIMKIELFAYEKEADYSKQQSVKLKITSTDKHTQFDEIFISKITILNLRNGYDEDLGNDPLVVNRPIEKWLIE